MRLAINATIIAKLFAACLVLTVSGTGRLYFVQRIAYTVLVIVLTQMVSPVKA